MDSGQIDELESRVKANQDDDQAWYELGVAFYGKKEWMKAYESFQNAEIAILNIIGESYKNKGDIDSATVYFRRAERLENKLFRIAPAGSHWLTPYLIISGAIAGVLAIPAIAFWPEPAALISLIIILLDLIVFMFALPFGIAGHISSKRRESNQFWMKIGIYDKQIINVENNPALPEFLKFVKIEKLKQKKARAAQEASQCSYRDTIEVAR